MSYTGATLLALAVAVVVDLAVLRTRLLTRKAFWVAYAIVLFFQLVVNGLLTGLRIVRYDPGAILGVRLFHEPVEDVGFGFAMVLLTLALWVWPERRARARRDASATPAAAPASRR